MIDSLLPGGLTEEICSYKSRANILYSCAESDSAGTD